VIGRSRRPTAAVLAYHNIVPDGESAVGDLSLHLGQRAFADQLDFLLERCEVVALEDLASGSGPLQGPMRLALTFDDAYDGTMTAGVEELRSRNLPATVFVPPGLLGSDGFWWDRLSPGRDDPLSSSLRSYALESLAGQQDRILEWAGTRGLGIGNLPSHARPASEETLLEGAAYPRITLGSHTWSHPNLAKLDSEALHSELDLSKTWLRSRAPRYIDWLAYPYGLRTDEVVAEVASRFDGALLIDGGLVEVRGRWRAPPHSLPRINVPRGLTLEGLAIRLAGLHR